MKKRALSIITSLMLVITLLIGAVPVAYAEEAMGEAQVELEETANAYMTNYLETKILKDSYTVAYDDYLTAMLCLKSGVDNEPVYAKLDTLLAEQATDYDATTFLNASVKKRTASYALAIAILYLEERGADVTDFAGENLLTDLKTTFNTEAVSGINPYAFQMVAAVVNNEPDADWEGVMDTLKAKVLASYVDKSATGGAVGINYFGVSTDNNGQVLPALLSWYGTDEDITAKIDKAVAWNLTQTDDSGAVVAYRNKNADSTGLALKLAAQVGNLTDAKVYYDSLLQFKYEGGLYKYTPTQKTANQMATKDILTGLLAYRNALIGRGLFDVIYTAPVLVAEEGSGLTVANTEEETETIIETIISENELGNFSKTNIDFLLKVTDAEADDTLAAQLEADGLEVGKYLDISLYYTLNGVEQEKITNAGAEITVTLEIPEDLVSEDRNFTVYRLHDGEVAAVGSGSGESVEIKSALFSTYVIAYADPAEEVADDTTEEIVDAEDTTDSTEVTVVKDTKASTEKEQSVDSPKTGDGSGIYAVIALLALTSLTGVSLYKRRENA